MLRHLCVFSCKNSTWMPREAAIGNKGSWFTLKSSGTKGEEEPGGTVELSQDDKEAVKCTRMDPAPEPPDLKNPNLKALKVKAQQLSSTLTTNGTGDLPLEREEECNLWD